MTKRKDLLTRLAACKEKQERLICEVLDDDSHEDVLDEVSKMAVKAKNSLMKSCLVIAFIELTYVRYQRILNEIDENTGYKEEEQ